MINLSAKNNEHHISDEPFVENIVETDIEKEMKNSFLQYSMSVIISRALPDVRDGLKPVHRRILYTMYENKLLPNTPYRKCADTVGSVLGRYHPHGDASVYDAMVRLAQDFSLRYPLVDGHGNFGSLDRDPPAAYRYTESRMSKLSLEMLADIDKETVDFMPNYDDRLKEPVVLPSRFPQLLCNGSVGIAVGMATNIPPHNLSEVVDAIDLLMENPDASLYDLMECIKGPDFPTGGIIMGRSGIRAAYATGKGKLILRSKTSFEEHAGRTRIVVNEIPYMVNKAELVKSIADLVKDKRIEGIYDVNDESDKTEQVRIVIDLKKDANKEVILNKLFSLTQLQDTVGVIMLAVVNNEPKCLSLKEILQHYIDFQIDVIERRTRYDLEKARARAHILEGLVIAVDNIDEVINIVRSSHTQQEAKQRLMDRFSLTEIQANAIAQMRIIQLTGLERQKIRDELAEIEAQIADFLDILAHRERVCGIIRDDLAEMKKKYGDDRRTEIQDVSGEVDIEDLIPVEEMVVCYTHGGYMKRMPVSAYKAQNRGGKGVTGMKQREDDFVEEMAVCSTHDYLLFITNKGIMYRMKCFEIPEGSKTSKGTHVVNLLKLSEDEKLAAMIKTSDFDDGKFIVMVTKNGKIKKTALSAYKNVRKNGLIAIGLDEGDEIAGVRMTQEDSELIVATRNGMAIRIAVEKLRAMSRTAHGVRAIKLRGGDNVVSMARVREGATVLTVSDKGLGRRTALDAYALQNRGGFGRKNYKVSDEKGYVCGIKVIDEEDDIIMISSDGIIIRLRAADIRVMGRYATGVRLMRLTGDGRVVTFTRAEHDDEAEVESVEQLSDEEAAAQEAQAATEEANEVTEPDTEPEDENEEG